MLVYVIVKWMLAVGAVSYQVYVGPKGAETLYEVTAGFLVNVSAPLNQCIYVQPVDGNGNPVTQRSNEVCLVDPSATVLSIS